ncbi:MAG: molecular chaperone DnaJ [Alphaproteobacteria bacterium]|nr:molecular chaperone DnaJ [Alphaproteobacteria bacterium]
MSDTDYYEILGVSKTASTDELKRAYRSQAMKYHPDRNPDNPEAEAKFKEINEAYDVLKDEQKRAAYDRYGKQAFQNGGMGGGNPFGGFGFDFSGATGGFGDIFGDIFSEFMGGGRQARNPNAPQDGADLRYNLDISLEEAFTGVEKEITVPHSALCENCHGHGTEDGKEAPVCTTCHGRGKVQSQKGGFFIVETTCPTCKGKGRIVKSACKKCRGEGIIHAEKQIKIKIPAGIESDTRMRVAGGGEAGLRGGQDGDLYVFINVLPHKLYAREGANLYTTVPVSMACAALGGKIDIPSIDGRDIKIDVPVGTQTNQQQKVSNEGMPIIRSSRKGDLYVRFAVETPVNLSKKQKELLEEFRSLDKDDTCQPQTKGFMDKIKDLFNVA